MSHIVWAHFCHRWPLRHVISQLESKLLMQKKTKVSIQKSPRKKENAHLMSKWHETHRLGLLLSSLVSTSCNKSIRTSVWKSSLLPFLAILQLAHCHLFSSLKLGCLKRKNFWLKDRKLTGPTPKFCVLKPQLWWGILMAMF